MQDRPDRTDRLQSAHLDRQHFCFKLLIAIRDPLWDRIEVAKNRRYYNDLNKGERHMGIIAWLIVGAIAGWLAGLIVKGGGFGLLGNIVIGIVGAVVAGWLLPRLGIAIGGGWVAEIINAMIGAVIVLVILALLRR